jgi:formylglycine-generating enzyme required for sulfatase activity
MLVYPDPRLGNSPNHDQAPSSLSLASVWWNISGSFQARIGLCEVDACNVGRCRSSLVKAPAALSTRAWLAYALIALVCLGTHGFLLTMDGVIWDGWYFLSWIRNRNWDAFGDYAWSQGMPFSLLLLKPLSLFPNVVLAGMFAVVVTLFLQGVVVYRLGLKLGDFTRSEALAFAVLYQSCPLVSAAQDFPILTLLFFHLLFFAGGLAAASAMERSGWRHWALRGAAIVALMMSCWTNGSLLMVYGSLYVAWFCYFVRLAGGVWLHQLMPFLRRYPDLLVLPPVTLWMRNAFSPQFGWFEDYNKPTSDPGVIWNTFWSFFENVVPYHVQESLEWPIEHPVLASLVVVFLLAWPRFAPVGWVATRGTARSGWLVGFAMLSFFLGVLPLAIIGKTFLEPVYGEFSRWSMHVPIPFALVTIALLRAMCFPQRGTESRWFPAIVTAGVVFGGSQIVPVYIGERVEWVFSRALLHQLTKVDAVRDASVFACGGNFSLSRQIVYGGYAFETIFGDKKRLAVPIIPMNGRYFTPMELYAMVIPTALVPNEFKAINPAGAQIRVDPKRQRDGMSDWEIAWQYLRLRWFGTASEMDEFLTRLVSMQLTMLRPATPFPVGEPAPPQPARKDPRDFINGAGVEMIWLPAGWYAGRFEVTQMQFERVMGRNPSIFPDPQRPVECVTWLDAQNFCDRLTQAEGAGGRLPSGMVYRLPTHEEFRYIEDRDAPVAAVFTPPGQPRWFTSRVGTMPENRLGLHDVHGNVWEWCHDWWDRDERFKLSLGGGWLNRASDMRAPEDEIGLLPKEEVNLRRRLLGEYRRDYPNQAFWDRGFRVVLAPPAPPQRAYVIDREPWRIKR